MRPWALPNTIAIVLMFLLLTACGGGSGGGNSSLLPGGDDGTGDGTGETGTPTITLSLVDESGDDVTILAGNDTATARALVADAESNPVSGLVVNFSSTIGQIDPANGTALTNAQGVAEVTVSTGTTSGAGTISASATVDETNVSSNQVGFETDAESTGSTGDEVEGLQLGICTGGTGPTDCSSVTSSSFTQGSVSLSSSQISAGGTAAVELVALDVNLEPVSGAEISFNSNCATRTDETSGEPLASITDSATTNEIGAVSATYQASGCEGDDTITARESTTGESATGTINVLSPIIGSIKFVEVSQTDIQIKGTGDSTATVTFQLLDVNGDPVKDEEVQFALTTEVGGLSLASPSGLTDEQGLARAIVNAGFIATTVRVRASLEVDTNSPPDGETDTTLETLSDRLSVNTGVADQNSMSLSADTLNIEGENFDGITTTLTVRLADRFNNPVPDGTTVQFRTELGSIDSSCSTGDGACQVVLTSQEPRRPLTDSHFNQLVSDGCPARLIVEEGVTISGSDGDTQYLVSDVHRVETTGAIEVGLTEGTDYTVDDDGSGITCESTSPDCVDTADLQITYDRQWLDEDADEDTVHTISQPGSATAPFRAISGVPCRAATRQRNEGASGFHGGMGQLYGGRSTVLAFAQGEESFVDSNANGQYDAGEPFVDLTEAFLDVNEDEVFGNPEASGEIRTASNPECYGPRSPLSDPDAPQDEVCFQAGGEEEEFVDFNANGSFDPGNGIYNGTFCPKEVSDRTNVCDNVSDPCDAATERYCTRELVNIRKELPILFSGSVAFIAVRDIRGENIARVDLSQNAGTYKTLGSTVTSNDGLVDYPPDTEFEIGHGDSQVRPGIGESVNLVTRTSSVIVDVADGFNGVLPAGTSISVSSGADGCTIENSPATDVTSTDTFGFNQIIIDLGEPETPPSDSASVTVTVSTPQEQDTIGSFTCSH